MDNKGVMLLQRDVVSTEAGVQLKISGADPFALALCLLARHATPIQRSSIRL